MGPSTEDVWTAFAEPLRRFIRKRVPNDDDSEDILQDVLVKIHQHLDQLDDAERLPAWVYQIARRAIIDHFRTRSKTPESVELPEEIPDERESTSPATEAANCIRPLIERLPEPYRQALVMTELDGRTQRELAETLGLSLSGAKSRVQRGREQLKAMLLECCHFELDRQGRIVDYEPRSTCAICPPSSPSR